MNKDDKDFLNEGIKVGVYMFAICVLVNIILDLKDIKKELEDVKREHHVIIQYQYKDPIKDTIYITKEKEVYKKDTIYKTMKPNDWK